MTFLRAASSARSPSLNSSFVLNRYVFPRPRPHWLRKHGVRAVGLETILLQNLPLKLYVGGLSSSTITYKVQLLISL
jgi:hypothetical protein